jgi:hypothetical protein
MGNLTNPISVEAQTAAHPHWCWASVAASVWTYFEKVPWTMEQVVVLALQPDCTGTFTASQGEIEWQLEDVLSLNNARCSDNNDQHDHMAVPPMGLVGFDDLQEQIDTLQRPVCVAVTFAAQSLTHFCVINDVFMLGGEPWISLLDPAGVPPGEQRMSFASFNSGKLTLDSDAAYPAVWSKTYYTQ